MPDALPYHASRTALWAQNIQLRQIIASAAVQLEKDYAQMVLMDRENGELRQIAFEKKAKPSKKYETGHARILTSEENTLLLEKADQLAKWKAVFAEAKAEFKRRADAIDQFYADIAAEEKAEKKRQAAEKKAAKEAEKKIREQDRLLRKIEAQAAKEQAEKVRQEKKAKQMAKKKDTANHTTPGRSKQPVRGRTRAAPHGRQQTARRAQKKQGNMDSPSELDSSTEFFDLDDITSLLPSLATAPVTHRPRPKPRLRLPPSGNLFSQLAAVLDEESV